MRSRTLTLTLVLATLVGGAAACRSGTQANASGSTVPASATTLRVVNQAFLDMDVYVVAQSGARMRLGTATGNSGTNMTIPSSLLFGPTTLRFIADPIGGSHAEVSTSILVNPGDRVEMTIPPQ